MDNQCTEQPRDKMTAEIQIHLKKAHQSHDAVFTMQENFRALWNVIRRENGNADAQIHKHPVFDLFGCTEDDPFPRRHGTFDVVIHGIRKAQFLQWETKS